MEIVYILDMSNAILSRESAEAALIKSISNFVWIFGLALVLAAYLVTLGYELPVSVVDAIRRIIVNAFWMIVVLRLIDVANDRISESQKRGYVRSRD